MDLKQFKLIHQTKDQYHIQHPSGKKMVIEKAGMSKAAHEAIKKFASGGPVSEGTANDFKKGMDAVTAGGSQPASTPSPNPSPAPQQYADGTEDVQPSPQQQPDPIIQAGQGQEPLTGEKLSEEQLLGREQKEVGAASEAQQAESGAEQAAADQFTQALPAGEKLKSPQDIADDYKAKDDQLMSAYQNQTIDPDRYYNNLSTPSKIAASLGIILSGFGSGASHQQNLALGVLQKSIDEDINSQKNDQERSLNLWKMNREALGDDQQANLATQNQLYTGLQSKIMSAQAGLKAPEAKLKGQQLIDQIEQQKIQNRLQLGLLNQSSGQGGVSQADPASLVPQMVPKEQQAQVFKEIKDAQDSKHIEDNLDKVFAKAAGDVKNPVSLAVTPASILNLKAQFLPLIHDKEGRVNEYEAKTLDDLMPTWYDPAARVAKKLQGLHDFAQQKQAAPTAKGFGINLQNFQSTHIGKVMSSQDQQALQWANSNPNDPRAAAIKQHLGQ
jgi:hypothetical protein